MVKRILFFLLLASAGFAAGLWWTAPRSQPPPAEDTAPPPPPPALSGWWPLFRGTPGLAGTREAPLPEPLVLRWQSPLSGTLVATPTVDAGRLYIGTTDNTFACLDLDSGAVIWRQTLPDRIEGAAALAGDLAIVGCADGVLRGLERTDGTERWTQASDGPLLGSINLWDGAEGPLALAGSYDQQLYAVRPQTGAVAWMLKAGDAIHGAVAVENRTGRGAFGSCDGLVRLVDLETGHLVAEADAGAYVAGSPVIRAGRVYGGHCAGKAFCLRLADGSLVWDATPGDGAQGFFTTPAVTDRAVLLGSRDGHLYCLAADTGALRWRLATRGPVDSSPVVAGKTVFFGSNDGILRAAALDSGAVTWSYEIGAAIRSAPALLDQGLLVGADDGRLYCFGPGGD